jgi:hypothetical protein
MFNETRNAPDVSGLTLAFIKSTNVQAFPCGRRRSEEVVIDVDGDGTEKDSEKFHIPFDPESRLNTESNNRKHAGVNGYKQTYLGEWAAGGNDYLTLSMFGYQFKIKLDSTGRTMNGFGSAVAEKLGLTSPTALNHIYANIRIEDVPLYSGINTYNTSILRDQTEEISPLSTLDLLNKTATENQSLLRNNPNEYFFFSGLSFSTQPLSGDTTASTISEKPTLRNNEPYQHVVSLRILDFDTVNNAWVVHQPALLPKVEHGDEVDSVKVGLLHATDIKLNGQAVPSLTLVDKGSDVYRLTFSDI